MQINNINSNINFAAQKPKKPKGKNPTNQLFGQDSDYKGIVAGLTTLSTLMAILLKSDSAKLSDISFDKGIASINGKKFTGTIKDVLKNGDKIVLKYKNGVIQSSEKTLKDNGKVIEKYWQYFDDNSFRVGTFIKGTNSARHASYKKGSKHLRGYETFSVLEENFKKGTATEITRFSQNEKEGYFINTKKDGRLIIGEKENGAWKSEVKTREQAGIEGKEYKKGNMTFNTFA